MVDCDLTVMQMADCDLTVMQMADCDLTVMQMVDCDLTVMQLYLGFFSHLITSGITITNESVKSSAINTTRFDTPVQRDPSPRLVIRLVLLHATTRVSVCVCYMICQTKQS